MFHTPCGNTQQADEVNRIFTKDLAMEDATSFGKSRAAGPSQEPRDNGRQIADSDAESGDDAMDTDDERPSGALRASVAENSLRTPDATLDINAPLPVEETVSMSIGHSESLDMTIEGQRNINSSLVNKSLERSGEEIDNPVVSAVKAPQSPLITDSEPKIHAINSLESIEQTEDTPETHNQTTQATTPDNLIEELRPDESPELPLVETLFGSTIPASSDLLDPLLKAENAVTKSLKRTKDSSLSSTRDQSAQASGTTLDGLKENARKHASSGHAIVDIEPHTILKRSPHSIPVENRSDTIEVFRDGSLARITPTSPLSVQPTHVSASNGSKEISEHETGPEPSPAELTQEQKRITSLQLRNASLNNTLASLTAQRTALLHSLATRLSPYTLADIPSVLKPYKRATYTPSTASHTQPIPAPITPEDDTKLMAEARQVIKDHIGRLHRYNEIRDVGQGLIGIIADQRGARIVGCMDEFGVQAGD